MKKILFLSVVLTILNLMFTGCQKPETPTPPPATYTISTIILGKGLVTPDKLSGIMLGSGITLKFNPEEGYSFSSLKINGIKIEIPSSSTETSYVIKNINQNQLVEVEFIETDILLISKLQPAFMIEKVSCYREDNDSFIRDVKLTQEEKSWKIYHYYPSMDIKVINPDGSIFWQEKWDLRQGQYKQGGQVLTKVTLTGEEFSFKAKPIWSQADNCKVYYVHTYKRK